MLAMIRSLGSQLRWAADLEMPDLQASEDFVVAGMGGSGISGDYVKAVTPDLGIRIHVHKDYGPLPEWVDRAQPLIVGISFSGNTEETLSVLADSEKRGLPTVGITSGGQLGESQDLADRTTLRVPAGLQPRAALGYLFGTALRVVGHSSGHTGLVTDLREAAEVADAISEEGSQQWSLASRIAEELAGRVTVVYGGGVLSGTAAQRWKTQINENAKMPAWWSVLPELDHNEIVGWETLAEMTSRTHGVVSISDRSDAPRVAARYRHTKDLVQSFVPWVGHVDSLGESAVARLISLTVMGDLVSWMLAENAGVDPVPVGTIEKLKKLLIEDDK